MPGDRRADSRTSQVATDALEQVQVSTLVNGWQRERSQFVRQEARPDKRVV